MSADPLHAPVDFVTNPRARRYILRVNRDGSLRVTVPRWGSRRAAERFILDHQAWIDRQRSKLQIMPVAHDWAEGTPVFWRGERVLLQIESGAGGERVAVWGTHRFRLPATCLPSDVRGKLLLGMMHEAKEGLLPRAILLAQEHGTFPVRIVVRAQKSRWGSCSRRGTVSLNWRLWLCPEFVTDYVILHELAHLSEMNHSKRFWTKVSDLCPDFERAEAWLKTWGQQVIHL